VKIYTARRNLSRREKEAWGLHNLGMAEYYDRSFGKAVRYFRDVLKILPADVSATLLMERSVRYQKDPPPSAWDGVEVMTHK
jgi:cytochrome c-type biogenesis protein CcmH/NrfG